MKRTLVALIALAFMATPALAQGFMEDFESGTLGVFTSVDYLPGSPFSFNATLDNYTNGSGYAAYADSDAAAGDYDLGLESHVFTVPAGASLMYTVNYQNLANEDFLDVDIDAGSGWVTLLSWNEDHGGFKAPPGEDVSLDLSAYAGQSAQIRFHWYNPEPDDWDWYVNVDDIAVTPEPAALSLLGLGALALIRRR